MPETMTTALCCGILRLLQFQMHHMCSMDPGLHPSNPTKGGATSQSATTFQSTSCKTKFDLQWRSRPFIFSFEYNFHKHGCLQYMCVQVVRALLKVGFFWFWYTLKSWPLHFNFWACEALTNLQQLKLRHLRLKAVSALSNKCFWPWWQLDLGGNVWNHWPSNLQEKAGKFWTAVHSLYLASFFI